MHGIRVDLPRSARTTMALGSGCGTTSGGPMSVYWVNYDLIEPGQKYEDLLSGAGV